MMTHSSSDDVPSGLRRLTDPEAVKLAHLSGTFEDLQTVLRCCERLVDALAKHDDAGPDELLIEALWTTALLSYSRCFTTDVGNARLSPEDLAGSHLRGDILGWHKVLLDLRAHYASRRTNPRELFSVGVAQDQLGAASGIGITGLRQPLVEDVAVRQTGAVALMLSDLVNGRIAAEQEKLFAAWKDTPHAALDELEPLDILPPEQGDYFAAAPADSGLEFTQGSV